MALNYLTVQDMLTINLELTGSKQVFDYSRLEEGVNYQYASGQSNDLVAQSARFFCGFEKMAPFESGNEACAFISLMVFLEANGKTLDLAEGDVAKWCDEVWSGSIEAKSAIYSKLIDTHIQLEHGVPHFAAITEDVIERYAVALADLSLTSIST